MAPKKSFAGNFDGDNHVISNMTITSDYDYAGLFGYLSGARVINVRLKNVNIDTENKYVGGLAGYTDSCEIRNCHVLSGSVKGSEDVGGLAGQFRPKYATGDLRMRYYLTGSSSAADVRGYIVDGLVGTVASMKNTAGVFEISDCYTTGNVTAYDGGKETNSAGGLVGRMYKFYDGIIENCYAAGEIAVEGDCRVGGLIGDPALGGGTNTPTEFNVENNIVLVPSMSGLAETSTYARVAGVGTEEESSVPASFKDNLVLDAMVVGGGEFTGTQGDNLNGTNRSAAKLGEKSVWEGLGFEFSEDGKWIWDASAARAVFNPASKAIYEIVITKQPTDAIAYTDKDASFSITASKGTGSFTYQWQKSTDEGKNWTNIEGAAESALTMSGSDAADGMLIRCQVTDGTGTVVYSDYAVLHVPGKAYTIESVSESLYQAYTSEVVTEMKLPSALYAYSGDLSNVDMVLHYYDTYGTNDSGNKYGKGLNAWAAIDYIARGGNPADYLKTSENTTTSTSANLISEYLDMQSAMGDGSFHDGNYNGKTDCVQSNIYYALALDMYYNGASTWGNENEEGTAGKKAAFNWFIGQLKDGSGKYGGKYFYNATKVANQSGTALAQRYQAEYVILMARFAKDPELKTEALSAMADVLQHLEDRYANWSTMYNNGEASARYASALVAAANVTEDETTKAEYLAKAKEIAERLLNNFMAQDGTFQKTYSATPAANGDAQTTAAVLMAFADVINGKCALAEMHFEASDAEILAADVSGISIPSVVLNDLDLPQTGIQGTSFTWTSSNEDVISKDGKVTRPEKDTNLVLTMEAVYGEATVTKEFKVKVTKEREAGGDEAYADAESLSLLPEYLDDITLPTEGENGTTITWTSSNPDVIDIEGHVTRPSIGEKDVVVNLTATVKKGDAEEVREFTIKIWADVDTETTEGMIKESYYQTRQVYMNKSVLAGYWDVWAAYTALGEDLKNFTYAYDESNNSEGQPGAQLLAIVALGENPYNYNGKNYAKVLEDAGLSAGWAVPVYNVMGAEAAGMKLPNNQWSDGLSSASSWLVNLYYGPDTGGWACVPISRHLDEGKYKEMVDNYITEMSTKITSYNALSIGCLVTGLTALYDAGVNVEGIAGLNPATDEPWTTMELLKTMYDAYSKKFDNMEELGSFDKQFAIEFCDLYNVLYNDKQVGWLECGVTREKLEQQKALAEAILAAEYLYTDDSIADVEAALKEVNKISEKRLAEEIADYGEAYYALYDAVRYAKIDEELQMDREAAKDELAEYKDTADYRDAEAAELAAILEMANTAIDQASSADDVIKAVANAKYKMDQLKTDAELTAEEEAEAKALAEAKEAAKKKIAEYKDADDYRDAQKDELKAAIDSANEAIDAAETVNAVGAAVDAAKAAMDAIKTDAQLTAEEEAAKDSEKPAAPDKPSDEPGEAPETPATPEDPSDEPADSVQPGEEPENPADTEDDSADADEPSDVEGTDEEDQDQDEAPAADVDDTDSEEADDADKADTDDVDADNQTDADDEEETPGTGDESNLFAYLASLMLAVMAAFGLRRKQN